MRTLVDIPVEYLERLNDISERQQQSRASVIREAIAEYLVNHAQADAADAFGLWKDHEVDGLAYQKKVREEW
ncbi:MAG: CopG family transcriptional regulator [Pseudomonas sp.]|uniref:ribbon-helix-helix protein, CopG family n=1 Tax=Pseudomonas sp. TaxID=306 RepID=UPI000CB5243E|nr:ribbon-helix-helix protein, CopG family [Pseudomonas sp.]PJI48689.1 MAG: CopG family transcriptional regulator [Pseudomonas sp.]